MSFDRKIDFVCPHDVVEEALFVGDDLMTVLPLRPIAAARSVRVRLNGIAHIPSPGLYSPASAIAAKKGPFTIQEGVNDTLTFSVHTFADQTITITGGQHITPQLLASELGAHVAGIAVSVSSKGRLQFKTRQKGRGAVFTIRSTGSTLAATLGLPVDRQFRGRQLSPGWSVVHNPGTLVGGTRSIIFDRQLRGQRAFVEISYTTVRNECRRCGGLGVENDWRYNVNGDVIEVRNEALLLQEIQKLMFTAQGSNSFHEWYGTGLLNTIGKKMSAAGIIQSFIVADIRDAFRRWQSIKRQQEEAVGQFVSDEEYPFRLTRVSITPDPSDPTILFVGATIHTRSRSPLQIARGVRIPLPADILGSTVQDGVIRQSLLNPVGFHNANGSGSGAVGSGQFQGVGLSELARGNFPNVVS